jgi:tripartite-type tricarboxylate transporter receptor subunit TctC
MRASVALSRAPQLFITEHAIAFGRIFMTALMRALAIAAIGLLMVGADASAQGYPNKQVRMIVPFGAGGPADVFARQLAAHLQERLKQNFVIENRPGAGAFIGTEAVAKSAPDGYTLLVMSNTHTTNESLRPDRPYELMRDFVPISPINESDVMMVVNPKVGVKNLKEFITLAKSKPGQLNYASSGPGTPYHMATELFKAMSGTDIVHVPHKASGDMRTSVLGGHVQMMFDAITVLAPTVREGKLIALGTSGKKRSTVTPDIPTVDEAGVPGYESTIWLGVMAPAKTPQDVIDTLNAEIRKIMARPDVRAAWAKQGANPMDMTPAAFDAYLRADIQKWAKVVERAGLAKKK